MELTAAQTFWGGRSGRASDLAQGSKMVEHAEITQPTGTAIYFAEPNSPWQRWPCENTRWPASAVSAQENGPIDLHLGGSCRDRNLAQHQD